MGVVHGSTDASTSTTIRLQEGEVFEKVELKSFGYAAMLTFTARNKDRNTKVFGPFSSMAGGNSYSLTL